MKFVDYPQKYEKRFNGERTLKNCNFQDISTDTDISNNEYRDELNKLYFSFQKEIFDYLVKMQWLRRRFVYKGKNREKDGGNGYLLDRSFCVFVRNFVGAEPRMMLLSQQYAKVTTYFNDFFPDFNLENPFKTKYKFPYKKITLEYLVVVHQMPCRIDLLNCAEKKGLGYADFLDFVMNYISSENEIHEEDIFGMYYPPSWIPPYVIFYKEKYEGRKKK